MDIIISIAIYLIFILLLIIFFIIGFGSYFEHLENKSGHLAYGIDEYD